MLRRFLVYTVICLRGAVSCTVVLRGFSAFRALLFGYVFLFDSYAKICYTAWEKADRKTRRFIYGRLYRESQPEAG